LDVLITGGYGFIGSHVANKFYKEGHRIVIIDNLSTGKAENVKVKHRFYKIDSEDSDCEKIFSAKKFDIVIHLSEHINSKNTSTTGDIVSASNNSGLVNILGLSEKRGVKKFIFASSASVYGNAEELPVKEDAKPNPISPLGMSSYIKEYYCIKWGEIYDLNILCLRIPNVYGPGQEISGEPGVITTFTNNIINGRNLIINGYGTRTRDFIYIEDLVDGIYRTAVSKECMGVINLSTNTECSIKDLAEKLSAVHKVRKIIYKEEQKGEIQRSRLDNTKVKKLIKWQPKYNLKAGLEKTIKWYLLLKSVDKTAKKLKKHLGYKKKRVSRAWVAYIENIIFFLVIAFLQWGHLFTDTKFFDLKIDYSIIYIIIMGILWGQRQAYLAMILSSALFIGGNLFLGMDIVTFVYTPENLLRLAAYILVGMVTGYSIERKNRDLESKDLTIQSLKNKYSFLTNVYNETKIIKNELENQIIDTEDSFGVIYGIIQKLDSLEIEKIFSSAVGAIERIMKTDSVSIYTLNIDGGNNFMRLRSRSVILEDKIPNSIKISNFKELEEVVKTKSIYLNRKLDPKMPVMMAPVIDEKKVIAIISVHRTNFENLTLHYENLFQTIVGLITNTLKRAYFFEASLRDKRYVVGTRILTSQTFGKILQEVKNNKEELGMSYALLAVSSKGETYSQISEKVVTCIRDNDYIGLSDSGKVYILLSNTKNNYANMVIERLNKIGIKSSLVEKGLDDL